MVKDVTFGESRVKQYGSGGTRTHAPEETGALNQRLNRSATLPSASYVTLRNCKLCKLSHSSSNLCILIAKNNEN